MSATMTTSPPLARGRTAKTTAPMSAGRPPMTLLTSKNPVPRPGARTAAGSRSRLDSVAFARFGRPAWDGNSTMEADDYMTYEEFGRKFFEIAVTEERVGGAIAEIAGDAFEMGPMGQ